MPTKAVHRFEFTILLIIGVVFSACAGASGLRLIPPSHKIWDELLRKHVDAQGRVSYKGMRGDAQQLETYLDHLSSCAPSSSWSTEERLAYWINAYNAFTVKLIIDHYPVNSIKDIRSPFAIPFVNSVWDLAFFKINGREMTLNQIEHGILRKEFEEPRIHFAIVCASISCPKLHNEAYESQRLEDQLHARALEFINDPSRNILSKDHLELSAIFKWFKGDFTRNGNLRSYIAIYSKVKVDADAKLSYLDYDWGLNGY
jgi:hypothetical protein